MTAPSPDLRRADQGSPMRMVELIERKRDGGHLLPAEISWLINSYTEGTIPDYQMAALLMAIVWRGLDGPELAAWMETMLHSGEILDFSHLAVRKVGKHSTGGVGDKVSIVLAPLVASCGIAVPKMSGRGLGHTGGTLDKLESIPGFQTRLNGRFATILEAHGVVIASTSESLAPADRRIYALRDTTGTVASIPLIATSIMSKKLAEGTDALVLDVKVGRGAFMTDEASARELAETMVGIGTHYGTKVAAVLSDMDQPLGHEVGNANEVRESIELLQGGGPDDAREVVLRVGEEMLLLAGSAADRDVARRCLLDNLHSGAALAKFAEMVEAQGGDPSVVSNPDLLPRPAHLDEVTAPRSGIVRVCDAHTVGMAGVRLGAGRATKEDPIDPAVGITILRKVGDTVAEGEPLARIGWNDVHRLEAARSLLHKAWEIGDEPAPARPLILGVVS